MDDCGNTWGTVLCPTSTMRSRGFNNVNDETMLKSMVKQDVGDDFVIAKITSSGSDANLFAICSVTNGETNSCLVACGSYVSGDDGPLQSWSTSCFAANWGPSSITRPGKVTAPFTRQHTVGLPYYVPQASISQESIEKYEDSCLLSLHCRCLEAKMQGTPYKALLLELMLAANGASLSDRALAMLGALANHHGFHLIVDEIMTGARTGHFLLSQTKPKAFLSAVSHVTLGKWLQLGVVLASASYNAYTKSLLLHTQSRGQSTSICCREAVEYWREVSANITNAEQRCSQVLAKLRVKPKDAWGHGALIFAPVSRKDNAKGTKNRFLPLLTVNTPLDNIPTQKKPEWSKAAVNKDIMAGVNAWVNFYPYSDEGDVQRQLVVKMLSECHESAWISTKQLQNTILAGQTLTTVSNILRQAEAAGLVVYSVKTKKRLRCWVVQPLAIPPWSQSKGK